MALGYQKAYCRNDEESFQRPWRPRVRLVVSSPARRRLAVVPARHPHRELTECGTRHPGRLRVHALRQGGYSSL